MPSALEDAISEVNAAIRPWARRMRELCSGDGNQYRDTLRWRNPSFGTFVLSVAPELEPTEIAVGSAFHLESYHRLQRALELARRLAAPQAGAFAQSFSPGDFALRTLYSALVLKPGERNYHLDETVLETGVSWLASALQVIQPMEVTTLLRQIVCRQTLELADGVHLIALDDQKLLEFVTLGFIAPKLEILSPFGTQVSGKVYVSTNARTALTRHVVPESQSSGHAIAAADFKRLLDAVALVYGKTCVSVGWTQQRSPNPFSGASISYQSHDSYQPPAYVTAEGVDIDSFRDQVILRWKQLEILESDQSNALLRSAARRIGYAAARVLSEDTLIDSVFAIEAALADGIDKNPKSPELGRRAGSLWAKAHGNNNARTMRKTFESIYMVRNKIAHGGAVEETTVTSAAQKAFAIAREVVALRLGNEDAGPVKMETTKLSSA